MYWLYLLWLSQQRVCDKQGWNRPIKAAHTVSYLLGNEYLRWIPVLILVEIRSGGNYLCCVVFFRVTMGVATDKNIRKHILNFQLLGQNLGLLWETEVKAGRSVGQRAERPVQADLRPARWRAQDALLSLFTASVLSSFFFLLLGRFHPTGRNWQIHTLSQLLSASSHPPIPTLLRATFTMFSHYKSLWLKWVWWLQHRCQMATLLMCLPDGHTCLQTTMNVHTLP